MSPFNYPGYGDPPLVSLLADLLAAGLDAVFHAKQEPVTDCIMAQPTVSPALAIAPPKIVLVKQDYQAKGHRLAVRLNTNVSFTGTGTLDATPGGQLRVYDVRGVLQALPMSIPGSRIVEGNDCVRRGCGPQRWHEFDKDVADLGRRRQDHREQPG